MAGVLLCEPTELYNILNQAIMHSRLTEPNYLCLLDARTKREYYENHLITALRVKQNLLGKYVPPLSIDLACVRYVIVYDGRTDSLEAAFNMDYDLPELDEELKDCEGDPEALLKKRKLSPKFNAKHGSAARCARVMQRYTRFPVQVLRGGYELFTTRFHFLRTEKVFWMPQELEEILPYPVEIIPSKLYMGKYKQACNRQIQKDLRIIAHINVTEEKDLLFPEDSKDLLHIPLPDSTEADMYPYFGKICHFVDHHIPKGAVLVYSMKGISRCSAAVMGYLIHSCSLYLKNAWNYVQKCKMNMRPNRGFVQQLAKWERQIYMTTITDVSEPFY
ncbi:serine/threonine/tyrosine-interacting-like protein 1 [Heteronotia binoei]|uniref:serine/threonine/tyrosine-interacting-like protein 1 n=1 Tax=Heteronotia binoei TaxID=13085 RepID=UPI00292F03FF|nr:serine/threonine/tyrosine-interacting-like protein 1 [Heteronotia binoei]XP_060115510.1 serine/threonine/tyrosine-interacting-like protein 1 [Heteronotia binoei]